MGSKAQAVEFFRQLDIFSDRFVKAELGLNTATSPWGSSLEADEPKGAVLHYTADDDLLRVLRWFLDPKWQSKCSSHAVVADRKLGTTQEMAKDLPLVAELPVTVVQCRLPSQEAWHATWCNASTYGIENVNVGEVRKAPDGSDGWVCWRPRDKSSPEWTLPWKSPYKTPVGLYGRFWEPYTSEQIEANVALLRYVRDYFGEGRLQRPWIVGHEAVQGVDTRGRGGSGPPMRTDKRDPGPTFPIHGIRYAVFDGWTPVGRYDWFNTYRGDPRWGQSDRDTMVVRVVRAMAGRPETPGAADPSPETAWARFKSGFQATLTNGETPFGVWGKLALWLLGFHVSSLKEGELRDPDLDSEDCQSVWIFQRLAGITTDGKPGKVTRENIWKRLQDRGFIA